MPKISIKGQQLPASPIRKLVPFAENAKKQGKTVYHLNIGQPDIETPQNVLDAINNMNLRVIEYSHSAGIQSYREKLVEYYNRFNIDVTIDEMIVTTGGSEAILFAMMSCMNPGDEIIIPEPFYANYNSYAITAGVDIVPVVSTIETGFALPAIEEFEKLITSKTKAIMICNPNNPTGYLYSEEELLELQKIVKKHDLFLFADEVYREFCYDGLPHVSAMHLKEITQNVVLLDSVSKRYSACGVRIGTLLSKNKDIIDASMKLAQARLSPPTFGQIASEAAIDTPDDYFKTVIDEYVKRRKVVVTALNNMENVYSPNPGGAFYTVARLPIDDSDKFCQWLLEEFDYNNETIMLAPATGFYSTEGLGKDEVRIGYVLNVEKLKKAMVCLEKAIQEYPGKTK